MKQIKTRNFKRVTKPMARKLFNEGFSIKIVPCNVDPENEWGVGIRIHKNTIESFDKIIDRILLNDCNPELGKYPAYYIPIINLEN